jgi:Leucine-rich repeat (LRR) protein
MCPLYQLAFNKVLLQVLPSNIVRLDVAGNGLTDLAGLQHLCALQTLDASHNRIVSAAAVAACSALRSLKLSHNKLSALHGIEQLRSLDALVVDHNCITALLQIRPLAVLSLDHLSVAGNPLFTGREARGHRMQLLNILPGAVTVCAPYLMHAWLGPA